MVTIDEKNEKKKKRFDFIQMEYYHTLSQHIESNDRNPSQNCDYTKYKPYQTHKSNTQIMLQIKKGPNIANQRKK